MSRQLSGPAPRTKQVLFVQGGGSGTHDSWDNKLVASLEQALGPDYAIHYPRMPDEGEPDPAAWKKTIAREVSKLRDGMFLVGHSVGAAVLMDYLAGAAIERRRVAGVFLIATPFIGDGGWPSEDLRPTTQLARELHGGAPLHFYQGGDDDTVPASHIEMFATAFPAATIRRLKGRDHQLDDDLSEVAHDIERCR
jgi:predicted alpha/beta hydrolase family esterase